VLPTVEQIINGVSIAAQPAGILSAFSSLCTAPWRGTCRGEVAPGTYSTRTIHPAITYTVPLGWTNSGDNAGFFGLIPPGGDYNSEDTDRINVFSSITTGNGRCADGNGTARTPEEFVAWLRRQPGFAPFTPEPVRFGSLSGVVVDLVLQPGFTATCPWSQGFPAQQVLTGLPPSPGDLNHAMFPRPMAMRLYLLHYRQGTLGIEIDDMTGKRMAAYIKVVDSFRFGA
jgi:hypothetical protein